MYSHVCVSAFRGTYVCSCFFLLLSLIDEKTTIFPTKETYCSKRVHNCETKKKLVIPRGGGVVAGAAEDAQRKLWEMEGKILKNDQFITDNWTAWWNSGDDIVIRLHPSICAYINVCVRVCVSVILRGFLMLSVSPFRQIGILAIPSIVLLLFFNRIRWQIKIGYYRIK